MQYAFVAVAEAANSTRNQMDRIASKNDSATTAAEIKKKQLRANRPTMANCIETKDRESVGERGNKKRKEQPATRGGGNGKEGGRRKRKAML